MGEKSSIQWTDATWNIARGCTKVDEDCKFCYMYRDSFDSTRYNPLEVVKTKTVFNLPLRLKEPSKIFTSSLTDVFHPAIDSYRNEMWDIIRKCPQHTFQILTKRPERIMEHVPEDWGNGWDNVWLGTSCGSQKAIQRATELLTVPAKTRFLSLEPLWEPIDLTECLMPDRFGRWPNEYYVNILTKHDDEHFHNVHPKIDWVIVGGESGNETGKYRYRPCELDWIEKIIRDCNSEGVEVFVKQLGTHLAKKMGLKDRHGGNMIEWPEHLQIREFPQSFHQ